MSLTKTFLLNPNLSTEEETQTSEKKYDRNGVRGKRICLGICILFFMYLIVVGNLITLILVASSLRLNSQGSSHFSFLPNNVLRFYSSLFADRVLVDGPIRATPSLSISSLSDIELRAGKLISDQAGVLSRTSVLSVTNNFIATHNITNDLILHTTLSNQDIISLSDSVMINSLVYSEVMSASSGFETDSIVRKSGGTLKIRGGTASLQGGRGASVLSQSSLLSAPNGTITLKANNINITASEYLLIPAKELTQQEDVTSLQLRLCACKNGALFLLRHSSYSCEVRGPVGDLC
ncbi:hypothetical protein LOD99_5602 [Oopsacas minuta]|uniref:Beta-sarcoglycan n=1 Tax=Oopsacas minuta TaxID=111878 RepID=A0AAV7JRI7_9METZ|nr:hypothetical protein LOD99_5602 [Oopsacas minuta]